MKKPSIPVVVLVVSFALALLFDGLFYDKMPPGISVPIFVSCLIFVFWIFIGAGFGRSFQAGDLTQKGGLDYLTYFYPGIVFLIILFTAIFSTFSLIQDRQEGYLQAVLVAPVARWGIVLGKVLGGSTLAFIQTFLFLIIALAMGILDLSLPWFLAGFVIFLNAFALTTLGFLFAWKINSIQGFHAIMNILLMPLWFLSGALFPQEGAPLWIRTIMHLNPLTYGLALLRQTLGLASGLSHLPDFGISLIFMIAFSAVLFVISVIFISLHSEGYSR